MLSINPHIKINQKELDYSIDRVKNPKRSGYWLNCPPIHIDDNWTDAAKNLDWVQGGDGSWGDPYIIENVTLDAGGSGNGILIENSNDYFIINNCTVYNSGSGNNDAGIKLTSVSNGTLINNNCSNNNKCGIFLYYSDNNTVLENNATDNIKYGIRLSYSDSNTVSGNNLYNNSGYGLILGSSNNNIVSGNNVANNSFYGMRLSYSDNNTVSGNIAYNNTNEGIYLANSNNNTISENNAPYNKYGIYLSYSDNNMVLRNDAFNNSKFGIVLSYSNNNTVLWNYLCNNSEYGIYLSNSNNNMVSGNTVHNNTYFGIVLTVSDYNTVSINIIHSNPEVGIRLDTSNNNVISENNAYNNGFAGIDLTNSDNTSTSGNNVYNNAKYGIYLLNSDNNTFLENLITNNSKTGIHFGGSNNNSIYNNVFLNNSLHAKDIGSDNRWNSSLIGNYWDNYTGLDITPFDGIGDKPYNISRSPLIQDFLPIVQNPIHNGSKIHVDGNGINAFNWYNTSLLKWWCTGSGTYSDPYVIENLVIDAQNSGSGIFIENSNVYFRIENCKVYNAGSVWYEAGIRLQSINNGLIFGNNVSNNNFDGIYLNDSNNNTISGNSVNYNDYGITVEDSSNNMVLGNIAKNNRIRGIFLSDSTNNTISGNTVNNNSVSGITLFPNSNNNTISGNTVNNNSVSGIISVSSYFNTISGNTINNQSTYGIYLENSNNNTISGNTAYKNSLTGIYLVASNNNTISGNIAINNTYEGIYLFTSNANMILGNTANNNDWDGISIESSDNNTIWGNIVHNNFYEGIFLKFSENNAVSGNNATNNGCGINLNTSNNNTVSGNIATNNKLIGIRIYNSNNNTVSGNTANNNDWDGISIENSDSNTICGNIVHSNFYEGIFLKFSENNTVSGNNATNNGCGINLNTSNNNMVSGNIATNNKLIGIRIYNSNNTTISGNNAIDNTNHGIYLEISNFSIISGNIIRDNYGTGANISDSNSQYNLFYNNSFINNQINAVDNGTINYWNNSVIGNFWSDYTGSDLNDNGIGDIPYSKNDIIDYLPIWDDGDSVKPIITINSPQNGTHWNTVPTINVTAFDLSLHEIWYSNGTVNIMLSNSVEKMLNKSIWNHFSDEGVFYLYIYAKDTNSNVDNKILKLYKDVKVPIITLTGINEFDLFKNSPPNINVNVIDKYLNTIWYSLENESGIPLVYSWQGSITQEAWDSVDNGIVTIKFYANDTAGNVGSKSIRVRKNMENWMLSVLIIDELGNGDYTWEEATVEGWCKGSGTLSNPYTIENVIINGQNSGSCIEIRNSNEYVVISNCSFSNSGRGTSDAGIRLDTSSNIKLLYDECINNNGYGIYLFSCQDILIEGCTINNNAKSGIMLYESDTNIIRNNNDTINSNTEYGIHLSASHSNEISGNTINHNFIGIYLNSSNYNNISNNDLQFNTQGPVAEVGDCTGNGFSGNYPLIIGGDGGDGIPFIIYVIIVGSVIAVVVIAGVVIAKKRTRITKIEKKEERRKEEGVVEAIRLERERSKEEGGLNVFISYSTLDTNYFQVSKIVKSLEMYPEINKVLFWEVDSKQNIVEFMEQTLNKTQVFVLFCSENSMKSEAVKSEWQSAYQMVKKGLMKIIPVYENEDHIPKLLWQMLNVKFVKDNFGVFIQKLYEEILR